MDLLLAFIIAVAVTMILIPPLMRVAGSLNVLDMPGERKQHSGAVPCVGGVAMAVGAFVPLLLWLPMDRLLASYLSAALVMVGFGVWDDRASLGAGVKFAGQLISVLIVVLVGHVTISSITLTERIALPELLAAPLTVFFLLGVTNAINLADGLDGLAGGTTLLACCALAALGITLEVPFVATIALVIVGSIVGFLRFNTYPARVFMGDGGSQFLGFTAGVLAIVLTQNIATPLSAALPLLILGLPILDTLTVMVLRILRGQSPFKADRTHIHHKLLALGFDHHEAVALIYCAQALLFLAAWFLRFESDLIILAVFLLFAAAFLATLLLADRAGWRVRSGSGARLSALVRLRRRFATLERKHRLTLWPALAGVAAYAACVVLYTQPLPQDVRWLVLGLAVVLILTALPRNRSVGVEWVAQAGLYVSVVVAVYLDQRSAQYSAAFHAVKWAAFPAIIIAVAVRMRLGGRRRFQITPFDVLLVIVALTLPNLPGMAGTRTSLGFGVAKLLALFYAVEMLSQHSARMRRIAAIGAMLFCMALVLSGCGGAEARKDRYLERGRQLMAIGRCEPARIEFRNAMYIDPGNADVRVLVGEAAEKCGGLHEAAQRYKQAIDRNTRHALARARLGRLYALAGGLDKARALVARGLVVAPDNADLLAVRALVELRKGDETGALEDSLQAIEIAPAHEQAVIVLATLYRTSGREADALQLVEQSLRKKPLSVDLRMILAQQLMSAGREAEARAQVREVARLEPGRMSYRDRLAQLLDAHGWNMLRQGEAEEATLTLQQALEENPQSPTLRYHLGMAQLQAGERSAARENLQLAVESGAAFAGLPEARVALSKLRH